MDEKSGKKKSRRRKERKERTKKSDAPLFDRKPTTSPEQFVEIRTQIGKGSFGLIYLGVQKQPRRQCAVKQLPYAADSEALGDIEHEIETMKRVQGADCVVQYFGSLIVSERDKQSLWILMEYAACGSLMSYIKSIRQPLSEGARAHALLCAARGLTAMHHANILHRDVKSDNLLWCADSRILLADLGEAAWCDDLGLAHGTRGTPYFMAPECALGTEYSFPADIWSLGITAIEMAEQKPPFHQQHPMQVMFALATGEGELPALEDPSKHSKEFVDMVRCMIDPDASKRPTAKALQEHPFFESSSSESDELHTQSVHRTNEMLGKTLTSSSSMSGTWGSESIDDHGRTTTSLLGLGAVDQDEFAAMREATQVRDKETGETCDEFTTNLLRWKSEESNADALQKLTSKLRHTATKEAPTLFATEDSDMAAFRRKFELMTCILTLASKIASSAFGLVTTDRWLGDAFYEKCFTAKDSIDWIYENLRMPLRADALQLVLHLEVNGMINRLTAPLEGNKTAIDTESQLFRFNWDKIKQWSRVYQYEAPELDDAEAQAEILHFRKKKDLNVRDWRLLMAGANALAIDKDVPLFAEGDENHSLYRIEEGFCRVEKMLPTASGGTANKVLARMGKDVMFGEMSVLSRDAKTSAAIVADSDDCLVNVIDVDFIFDLFRTEPGLKQRFYFNTCLKLVGMIKSKDKNRAAPKTPPAAPAPSSSPSEEEETTESEKNDIAFQELFDLEKGEVVIDRYECFIKQFAVKQHGTMYVSTNYVCFRSKVFGKVTKYVIPTNDIEEVSLANATTISLTRKKRKSLKLGGLHRAEAAVELCNKLVARAARPELDVRSAMSFRGPRLSSSSSSRSSSSKVARRRHSAETMDVSDESSPTDTTLTSDDWDLLLAGAKSATVAKDTVIIAEDEWATRIYQIGKGSCRVEIGGKVLGKMEQGEVFGEISFLEGNKTTANVIADEDNTEILVIEGGVLKVLFVRQPALAGRFFNYLATMLSSRLKQREEAQ